MNPGGDCRAQRRWRRRPSVAATLRVTVVVVRIVVTALAAVTVSRLLPVPHGAVTVVGWWAMVVGSGVLASLATERLARRVAPLAVLYDLSLSFPDATPSRFRLARQVRDVDEARARMERIAGDEDTTVQEAVEAALVLIASLESHHGRTRGHSERVRLLVEMIADELGMPERDRVKLRWSAVLHDLGKLTVHAPLLSKAGALGDDEWAELRRHPIEGARYVAGLRPWLGEWVDTVEQHHERWDGNGYPHGLAGEQISLGGRIVAVADAFDAMTANRGYNQPVPAAEGRREVVAQSGRQFDPRVVRAFVGVSLPQLRKAGGWWAWVGSLPILALVGRVPREATTVAMAGAVAVAATFIAPSPTPSPGPRAIAAPPAGEADPSQGTVAAAVTAPDDGSMQEAPNQEPRVLGVVIENPDAPPDPLSDLGDPDGGDPAPADGGGDAHGTTESVAPSTLALLGDAGDPPSIRPMTEATVPAGAAQRLTVATEVTPGVRAGPTWSVALPTGSAALGSASATLWLEAAADTSVLVDLLACDDAALACEPVGSGQAPVEATDGLAPVRVAVDAIGTASLADRTLVLVVTSGPAELTIGFGSSEAPSRLDLTMVVPDNLLPPDHRSAVASRHA